MTDFQYVADRLAISDTVTRYFTAIDSARFDMFVDVFTEDVQAEFDGVRVAGGRQGVVDFLTGKSPQTFPLDIVDGERGMHFMGNHAVTIDGDVAYAETYMLGHIADRPDGELRLRTRGIRYEDELQRQPDGRWLISKRRHIVQWMRLDNRIR